MRVSLPALLAVLLVASGRPGAAQETVRAGDPSFEGAIAEDLRTALVLEGHPCAEVVEYQPESDSSYVVGCSGGRRYRLAADDEQGLLVTDLVGAPFRILTRALGFLPIMRIGVGAVTRLVGLPCDAVASVRGDGAGGQFFTCADGGSFHVVVTESGRVEVLAEQ